MTLTKVKVGTVEIILGFVPDDDSEIHGRWVVVDWGSGPWWMADSPAAVEVESMVDYTTCRPMVCSWKEGAGWVETS